MRSYVVCITDVHIGDGKSASPGAKGDKDDDKHKQREKSAYVVPN